MLKETWGLELGKKKEVEKGKKIMWVENWMLAIYSKGFEFEE